MSLSILAKKAVGVPKEKLGGKSDPYCQITYQGQKVKTKVVKESENPEWNENLTFDLAGQALSSSETFLVELRDWERIGSDKLIGQASVPTRDLVNRGELSLQVALTDKNGRPTQTTVDLQFKYQAPASAAAPAAGAPAASTAGGAGVADAGEGGDAGDGEDGDGDEGDGEVDVEDIADAGTAGGAGASAAAVAAARKRKRERKKRRAQLSTKPQDFQVRVKVVEARQLEGSNVHPICKITLFGETKESRVKRCTGSPVWNEVFYYSNNISPAEIVDEMITFEVFNSKRLRSDALIGTFSCDCGLIYDKSKHTILNKWLLLSDPEDTSGVRGYLKVSIAILGPGDEAMSFKTSPADQENDDIEANLLMPAGMSLQPATFTLHLFHAEDLPRMDSAMMEGVKKLFSVGKHKPKELSDPYLVFTYAGQVVQSKVVYESYSPEFNQQLKLGFKFPSVAENLTLRMFDWDRLTAHDTIASGIVSISQVSRSGEDGFLPCFGPCYVNFYGSTREFNELGDEHGDLNKGLGEGIAYRGRVLIELKTALEENVDKPVFDCDPAEMDRVAKYMRRNKFMLHVAFMEATMICDTDAPVEFEVSIGPYGNKLDDTVMPSASSTQPTNAVFDGCRYNFLPWENRKPCIAVECFWEDIIFRLDTINLISNVVEMMESRFRKVKTAEKASLSDAEIKILLYKLMDEVAEQLRKPLPRPTDGQNETELDKLMLASRQSEFAAVLEDMDKIRLKDPEPGEILTELGTVCETLRAQSVEPQNSIPDVFVWMLVGNKRKAYYRIPAHEIIYSPNGYSGKSCGKDLTLILKHPGKKADREWEIPAKLRVKFWFGKKQHEEKWYKQQTDDVVVMAETYENQVALLGKWVTSGPAMTRPKWSDSTGNLKLPKEKFNPPAGWQWAGEWHVNPEMSLIYERDAGRKLFIEDVYELQTRIPGGPWSMAKVCWTDAKNDTMLSKDEIKIPEGWKWDAEWTVDTNRGVDDEGFEYCVESTIGGFGPVEKTYHLSRRRRWIRQRTMVADAKQLKEKEKAKLANSEGWEYAPLFNMKFHAKEAKMDLVRRRRWHRKLKPAVAVFSPCYFSFEGQDTDAEGDDDEEKLKAGCLAAPRMFLEASQKNKYQLRAYIYQARSLPAADDCSTSDPYAVVSFGVQSQITECIKKTLSPMWDQTLIFDEITLYGAPDVISQNPPEVVIEVFDKDNIGKDDFLGRAICKPMVRLTSKDPRTCILQWQQLTNQKGEAGEILASFELFLMNGEDLPFAPPKRNNLFIVPTGIRPVMRRTAIEVLCWGVRNMKKYQLISITSPSVEFEVGGAVVHSPVIKNTRKNPNFSQALLFLDTMLPKEEYFMPPVNIRVRDNRAFGRKPTVGMHVIRSLNKYIVESTPQPTYKVSDQRALEGGPAVTLDTILDMPDGDKLVQPPDATDLDWWSKFYASTGETDKAKKYIEQDLDTIGVLESALEDMPEYAGFNDFCDTFEIMAGDANDDDGQEVIGEFKGAFRVYELPEDPQETLPPRHLDRLPNPAPEECVVRVYLVQAYDLQPADPNGMADPYVEVTLGKKTISLRDEYKPNTLTPVFGQMLEFKCLIPIQKDLKITVKDFDLLTSDDVIGETTIDLENRYLSQYRATCGVPKTYYSSGPNLWRDSQTPIQILEAFCKRHRLDPPMFSGNTQVTVSSRTYRLQDFEANKKPNPFWGAPQERLACYVLNTLPVVKEHVETRILRNKLQPTFDQGKLQCWVDIFPTSLGPPGPPVNIAARVPKKYMLRVVIWNTTDVVLDETNIAGESMSDIYVKGWLPGTDKQKTDIHYRSLDGDGNFNWRFVFPFEYLPAEQVLVSKKKEHFWSLDATEERVPPRFTVQIWDNDFISADDFLGSVELNLNSIPKPVKTSSSCKLTQLQEFNPQANCVSLFEQKKLNGFWPVYNMVEGKPQLTGKVEMELELVTEKEAEERPAGVARDEPNMNPKLDPPNRPATSFFFLANPLKSCRYILWRNYKWYIIGILLLLLLVILVIIFIYSFPGGVWNAIFKKT